MQFYSRRQIQRQCEKGGSPPPVGSTITFRYQELSDAGVPRFPRYMGIRHDASPAPSSQAPKAKAETKIKVATEVSTKPIASADASAKRYFEFIDASSSKFWEISRSGNEVTTRWGKIGTDGQSKTKAFQDETAAKKEYDKLIEEKTDKGYKEREE